MTKQLSLFAQSSLNINRTLKEQMAFTVKELVLLPGESTIKKRQVLLDRMNDLAGRYGVRLMKGSGRALTMTMFEKWLNQSAMEYVPGVNALLIFCAAAEDNRSMRVLLDPLGEQVIGEADSKLLQWAKEYQRARSARKNMRKLEAEYEYSAAKK